MMFFYANKSLRALCFLKGCFLKGLIFASALAGLMGTTSLTGLASASADESKTSVKTETETKISAEDVKRYEKLERAVIAGDVKTIKSISGLWGRELYFLNPKAYKKSGKIKDMRDDYILRQALHNPSVEVIQNLLLDHPTKGTSSRRPEMQAAMAWLYRESIWLAAKDNRYLKHFKYIAQMVENPAQVQPVQTQYRYKDKPAEKRLAMPILHYAAKENAGEKMIQHILDMGWGTLDQIDKTTEFRAENMAVTFDSAKALRAIANINSKTPKKTSLVGTQQGCHLLVDAVRDGSFKSAKALIEMGCSVNTVDKKGNSLLHEAVRRAFHTTFEARLPARLKIINHLVNMGANKNLKNKQGLTPAALNSENLDLLNESKNKVEGSSKPSDIAIAEALERKHQVCVAIKKVLNKNPKQISRLHKAVLKKQYARVRKLIQANANLNAQDSTGATPLMKAFEIGDFVSVQMLVRAGAKMNINKNNKATVLHYIFGTSEQIKWQIDQAVRQGVDVNAQTADGKSVLKSSFWLPSSWKILLQYGVPKKDFKWVVSQLVAESFESSILGPRVARHLKYLHEELEIPLNDEYSGLSETYLMMVAGSLNFSALEVTEALLASSDVDINARNEQGHTALQIAEKKLQDHIQMLKSVDPDKLVGRRDNKSIDYKKITEEEKKDVRNLMGYLGYFGDIWYIQMFQSQVQVLREYSRSANKKTEALLQAAQEVLKKYGTKAQTKEGKEICELLLKAQ